MLLQNNLNMDLSNDIEQVHRIKRDAMYTPLDEVHSGESQEITMKPTPDRSLPSSAASTSTQTTGTDTSFDFPDTPLAGLGFGPGTSTMSKSSTSTPELPPAGTPKLRGSFESLKTSEMRAMMPADHPKVDLSNLPSWSHLSPEHAYEKKKFDCPCPAIATLVNHNYITPKTKNERVPWYTLVTALRECFNLDIWNSLFLTLIAVFMCGNWWAVSLKDLQRHNKVEHDASITRHDFNTGKDFRCADHCRLQQFMDLCPDEKNVTLQDYALRRCQVESQLWLEGSHLFRYFKHSWIAFLGRGEVALTMRVFGGDADEDPVKGMTVRKDWLNEWFKHEKLPEDWKRPEKPFNVFDTFKVGFQLNKRMNAIREEDEQLQWCACPRSSCL